MQHVDSMLTLKYHKGDIDTAYIIRPRTKWTITARMNVSGAKIKTEGMEDGRHFYSEIEANRKAEDVLVKEWIRESYLLVASKLPKATRSKYLHA